jgi:hypothetical protein
MIYTAVLEALSKNSISGNDVLGSVITISRIAEDAMGGTSGALYSSVKFLLVWFISHNHHVLESSSLPSLKRSLKAPPRPPHKKYGAQH